MKNILFSFALSVLFVGFISAQDSVQGHFLVEFAKFSPPTQDLVKSFEGFPAEQFLAKDIKGTEHFLGSFKGKKVLLWFWSVNNTVALEQVTALSLLQERNSDLKVISFAKEPKADVVAYLRQYPMEIDVIPNGEIFGQMAYGAELGSPRMFLIDEFGVIKVVLPSESFTDNSKLLVSLESILNGF
ncbi:MAG: hypothetical protein V3V14_06790 [Saprospiraceae bacterium]